MTAASGSPTSGGIPVGTAPVGTAPVSTAPVSTVPADTVSADKALSGRAWTLYGTSPGQLISDQGFCLLAPRAFGELTGVPPELLADWRPAWDRLLPDRYLRDGGSYRTRRHSCFIQDLQTGSITQTPHRPHWQSTDYNALHGGIERWFEPIEAEWVADPRWQRLLGSLGRLFAGVAAAAGSPTGHWFIEAHPFRIDASGGVGRPTPEGAHRDGVDYVAVILVDRHAVKGGETRVFEADGPTGMRFVIESPWSALLLDDTRMIHETTPIQPAGPKAWRDTLVITWRRNGFQAA